ncbi:MAG TPA: glycosyltransferase [Candidatus Saccharimonadales bacterium]|nr:glycosyltransferase [Candidatus Saccharimonadales bacterium]
MKKTKRSKLRVGLVTPHIFLHNEILPNVIFSPGQLSINLANGLSRLNADVTLFSPGPVDTIAKNITADLSYFDKELKGRGDSYIDLLKKHPFTFVTLARQVQSEIIAKAYTMANAGELDVVHIYTNEEDTALPFASLCKKPVVFTHHDPFNFLVKYKSVFPKYSSLNWISMSLSQRRGMPKDTNWVGNVYHGLPGNRLTPVENPTDDYFAYLGRIIEPKGLHLAIEAAKLANVKLKIAGKHYSGRKDTYWQKKILPEIKNNIEYVGFIKDDDEKMEFLGNARALIVPSVYEEPFGIVSIEALACGTPVIGLKSGATSEIIEQDLTGTVVDNNTNKTKLSSAIARAIRRTNDINRRVCRAEFEKRFTLERMCQEHLEIYKNLKE